jgi:hypothetical protein
MLIFAIALFANRSTRADATAPTSPPSDKWIYTLFNPVPVDLLRDMDTDRPDKTDSPITIDAGHLQLEAGAFDYTYFRDRSQDDNIRAETLDFGQFNFRLGILNDLELNAIINAVDFSRTTDYAANQSSRQNGFGDTIIGGKLNFWGNDGPDDVWATSLGLEPTFKIPTARQDLGNGHGELFVGVPFLLILPAEFNLSAETTVSWERNLENTGDLTGWQNSASIDRVFFGKFDIYLEYWSHVSSEHHQKAEQTIDTGFTYPWSDNVILDTGFNFGLNNASTTFEWLAGVSVRI